MGLLLFLRYNWQYVVIGLLLLILAGMRVQIAVLSSDLVVSETNAAKWRDANAANMRTNTALRGELKRSSRTYERRLTGKGQVQSRIKEIDVMTPSLSSCAEGTPDKGGDNASIDNGTGGDPILRELNRMFDGSGRNTDRVH